MLISQVLDSMTSIALYARLADLGSRYEFNYQVYINELLFFTQKIQNSLNDIKNNKNS